MENPTNQIPVIDADMELCELLTDYLTVVEFSPLEELLLKAGRLVRCEELAVKALGRSLSPYDRSNSAACVIRVRFRTVKPSNEMKGPQV